MSSFTTPLKVEVLNNGKDYKLLEPFIYYRKNAKSKEIKVPKGFVTDFASTPRVFWSFLPPFGKHTKSAVLHDYLCSLFFKGKITRKEADLIFLESMKVARVNIFTCYALFLGVRFYALLKAFK